MKYNNKADERLKSRLGNTINLDKIVSANKMGKARSSLRSAKFNIGKIVNKQSEYDKINDKAEDKINNTQEKENVQNTSIKVFNKGNKTYINYKNNDLPLNSFIAMSNKDNDVKTIVNNASKEMKKQNFSGSISEFLTKQYS